MSDSNTVGEREYSLKQMKLGDYTYSEIKDEAESLLFDMLYQGELTEVVEVASKDLADHNDWMRLIGAEVYKSDFFKQQFTSILMDKMLEQIIERLDNERREI